jgi:hypothetical protein
MMGETDIAAIARIRVTTIFIRRFICTFQIMNMGMIASVQSAAQEMAEYPYVALTVIVGSIHDPSPPVYWVQK